MVTKFDDPIAEVFFQIFVVTAKKGHQIFFGKVEIGLNRRIHTTRVWTRNNSEFLFIDIVENLNIVVTN